eukprot:gb/GECH01011669.1/.p1 GENE.gb/GECH01011669.1/~~gb/GECH01011669.1/.p1  ORF type:complete len:101 (+),score=28.84 gb/GECH01011669.1/:1-303(+)
MANNISTKDTVKEYLNKSETTLVDVRTVGEYNQDKIDRANNIPLDQLPDKFEEKYPDKEAPYVLHCRSGGRSGKALDLLKERGYTNMINGGGINDVRAAM